MFIDQVSIHKHTGLLGYTVWHDTLIYIMQNTMVERGGGDWPLGGKNSGEKLHISYSSGIKN